MPVISDWSYTSPSNSSADAVRFLIGDTNENAPLFTDTEIAWLLTEWGNKYAAAAAACEHIALELSAIDGAKIGDVAIGKSADAYLKMAERYRRQGALQNAMPFAGGISVADKQSREDDDDRVRPAFTRRLFADYLTGAGSTETVASFSEL